MNQRPQPNDSSFSRWFMFIRALVSAAVLVAVLPGLLMRGFQKKEAVNPNASQKKEVINPNARRPLTQPHLAA